MTPDVATATRTGLARTVLLKAPISIRNSPTKPFSPGRPAEASTVKIMKKDRMGTDLAMPPKSSIARVCRRSYIMPTMRKRAPVEMP